MFVYVFIYGSLAIGSSSTLFLQVSRLLARFLFFVLGKFCNIILYFCIFVFYILASLLIYL